MRMETIIIDVPEWILTLMLILNIVVILASIIYLRQSIKTKRDTANQVVSLKNSLNTTMVDISDSIHVMKDELNFDIKIIKDKLNNNIHELLFDILIAESKVKLGRDSFPDKGLWRFFKNNIRDIVESYYQIRDCGLKVLKESAFKANLLSSPISELKGFYTEVIDYKNVTYPMEFMEYVEVFQESTFSKCIDNIIQDLALAKYSNDSMLDIVKSNIKDSFRIAVSGVIDKYLATKHLIGSNADTIEVDTKYAKSLLANGNIEGLIVELIRVYADDHDKLDRILIASGNYSIYKRKLENGKPTDGMETAKVLKALNDITNERNIIV